MSINILITGHKGQLGNHFVKKLNLKKFNLILPDYDINNYKKIEDTIKDNYSSVKFMLHCAAYTDVNMSNIDRQGCYRTNVLGTGVLASLCATYKIHLIYISTDFVFDGTKAFPYTEDDNTNPLNYYGETKLMGENIIKNALKANKLYTIFRTQWVYGGANNFFIKILNKVKENPDNKIYLPDDEIGSPCSVNFIYKTIFRALLSNKANLSQMRGETFNLTNDDFCSRYECGKYFLDNMGYKDRVINIRNLESEVKRPKFGALDNTKLKKLLSVRYNYNRKWSWKEELKSYLMGLPC